MASAQTKYLVFAVKFLAILTLSVAAAAVPFFLLASHERALFPNSDFEKGDLSSWLAEGSAFMTQPTFGDNPLKRGLAQPAAPQGSYWIGTYEKRPNSASPEGAAQGELPTGRLTSTSFVIKKSKISFLAGGGNGSPQTAISLAVNGQTVLTYSPNAARLSAETLQPVSWDVTPWINQKANIVISDQAIGGWGHINADDFHYA